MDSVRGDEEKSHNWDLVNSGLREGRTRRRTRRFGDEGRTLTNRADRTRRNYPRSKSWRKSERPRLFFPDDESRSLRGKTRKKRNSSITDTAAVPQLAPLLPSAVEEKPAVQEDEKASDSSGTNLLLEQSVPSSSSTNPEEKDVPSDPDVLAPGRRTEVVEKPPSKTTSFPPFSSSSPSSPTSVSQSKSRTRSSEKRETSKKSRPGTKMQKSSTKRSPLATPTQQSPVDGGGRGPGDSGDFFFDNFSKSPPRSFAEVTVAGQKPSNSTNTYPYHTVVVFDSELRGLLLTGLYDVLLFLFVLFCWLRLRQFRGDKTCGGNVKKAATQKNGGTGVTAARDTEREQEEEEGRRVSIRAIGSAHQTVEIREESVSPRALDESGAFQRAGEQHTTRAGTSPAEERFAADEEAANGAAAAATAARQEPGLAAETEMSGEREGRRRAAEWRRRLCFRRPAEWKKCLPVRACLAVSREVTFAARTLSQVYRQLNAPLAAAHTRTCTGKRRVGMKRRRFWRTHAKRIGGSVSDATMRAAAAALDVTAAAGGRAAAASKGRTHLAATRLRERSSSKSQSLREKNQQRKLRLQQEMQQHLGRAGTSRGSTSRMQQQQREGEKKQQGLFSREEEKKTGTSRDESTEGEGAGDAHRQLGRNIFSLSSLSTAAPQRPEQQQETADAKGGATAEEERSTPGAGEGERDETAAIPKKVPLRELRFAFDRRDEGEDALEKQQAAGEAIKEERQTALHEKKTVESREEKRKRYIKTPTMKEIHMALAWEKADIDIESLRGDMACYLRFLNTALWCCKAIALAGLLILTPMYLATPIEPSKDHSVLSLLDLFSAAGKTATHALWLMFFACWVFSGIVYYAVYSLWHELDEIRTRPTVLLALLRASHSLYSMRMMAAAAAASRDDVARAALRSSGETVLPLTERSRRQGDGRGDGGVAGGGGVPSGGGGSRVVPGGRGNGGVVPGGGRGSGVVPGGGDGGVVSEDGGVSSDSGGVGGSSDSGDDGVFPSADFIEAVGAAAAAGAPVAAVECGERKKRAATQRRRVKEEEEGAGRAAADPLHAPVDSSAAAAATASPPSLEEEQGNDEETAEGSEEKAAAGGAAAVSSVSPFSSSEEVSGDSHGEMHATEKSSRSAAKAAAAAAACYRRVLEGDTGTAADEEDQLIAPPQYYSVLLSRIDRGVTDREGFAESFVDIHQRYCSVCCPASAKWRAVLLQQQQAAQKDAAGGEDATAAERRGEDPRALQPLSSLEEKAALAAAAAASPSSSQDASLLRGNTAAGSGSLLQQRQQQEQSKKLFHSQKTAATWASIEGSTGALAWAGGRMRREASHAAGAAAAASPSSSLSSPPAGASSSLSTAAAAAGDAAATQTSPASGLLPVTDAAAAAAAAQQEQQQTPLWGRLGEAARAAAAGDEEEGKVLFLSEGEDACPTWAKRHTSKLLSPLNSSLSIAGTSATPKCSCVLNVLLVLDADKRTCLYGDASGELPGEEQRGGASHASPAIEPEKVEEEEQQQGEAAAQDIERKEKKRESRCVQLQQVIFRRRGDASRPQQGPPPSRNTGVAIVTFDNRMCVREVIKDVYRYRAASKAFREEEEELISPLAAFDRMEAMMAPPPADIQWKNLHISRLRQKLRMILLNVLLVVLCLTIISPVVLLSQLSPIMGSIDAQLMEHRISRLTITAWLPPLILLVVNSYIQPLLVAYVACGSGFWLKSQEAAYIVHGNIAFQLLNTLLIPLLSLSSIESVLKLMYTNELTSWSVLLGYSLVHSSGGFAMRYLVNLSFLGAANELLQLYSLVAARANAYFFKEKERKKYPFDLGYAYAQTLSVFTLLLLFSVVVPLLLPLGLLYFCCRMLVDKYNYVYHVHAPLPFESDATLVAVAMKYMLFAASFLQFAMAGFFCSQKQSTALVVAGSLMLFVSLASWITLCCFTIPPPGGAARKEAAWRREFYSRDIQVFLPRQRRELRDAYKQPCGSAAFCDCSSS